MVAVFRVAFDGVNVRSTNTSHHPQVPIAQLAILTSSTSTPTESSTSLSQAVSVNRRELKFCAETAAKGAFGSVDAQDLEYAIEPINDFFEYVHDAVFERKDKPVEEGGVMDRGLARTTLGLEGGEDAAAVKKAYRKMTMKYHPDRFVGSTDAEKEEGTVLFNAAVKAYEALTSGGAEHTASGSWYESLGMKSGRTEFKKIEPTLPVAEPVKPAGEGEEGEEEKVVEFEWQAAVRGLDPEVVNFFVARGSTNAKQGA